ncbi:MAG: FTR1 family protein [Bacillota bacterium]|nr:FTR1 family protein [Bacillota bacterium]
MFAPFIICFREGIEIFLIIIPLVVYFNSNKMREMSISVFKGGVVGAFLATFIGTVLFTQAAALKGTAGELFDGILGIVLSILVLVSVIILRKTKNFSTQADQKIVSMGKKGVAIISAITFFRELLEAVLFILASSSESGFLIVTFSILGLLCAALSVYIVSKGIFKLKINLVFYVLNLFLVGLGAYYFGDGLEVLFGSYVSEIFKIGILVYAIPSYFLMLKKDLKKYLNSVLK